MPFPLAVTAVSIRGDDPKLHSIRALNPYKVQQQRGMGASRKWFRARHLAEDILDPRLRSFCCLHTRTEGL